MPQSIPTYTLAAPVALSVSEAAPVSVSTQADPEPTPLRTEASQGYLSRRGGTGLIVRQGGTGKIIVEVNT
jgi:hypothetical protein